MLVLNIIVLAVLLFYFLPIFLNHLPMRPTKLIARSEKSFADATKRLITRALAFSGEIKSLRILEDRPAVPSADSQFCVKAHILKRS